MLQHCGPGAVPRQWGLADEGMRDGCSTPLAPPALLLQALPGVAPPSLAAAWVAWAVPNMCVPAQGHARTMCGIISLYLWTSEQATEII